MPNRVLREGILTSERIAQLGWPAEVFYRRLMSVVDDFGRYWAKPELLRAGCYPLHLDRVGNSDIGKWLDACRKAALVRTYTVAGKEYLELLDFRQHVRADKSKFPQPPADAPQVQSMCSADAHVVGDVVEDEDVDEKQVARGDKSPSPAGAVNGEAVAFIPIVGGVEYGVSTELLAELEAAYPQVDGPQTLKEIRAWCITNPGNRKTAKGVPRFINRWFERVQNGR